MLRTQHAENAPQPQLDVPSGAVAPVEVMSRSRQKTARPTQHSSSIIERVPSASPTQSTQPMTKRAPLHPPAPSPQAAQGPAEKVKAK